MTTLRAEFKDFLPNKPEKFEESLADLVRELNNPMTMPAPASIVPPAKPALELRRILHNMDTLVWESDSDKHDPLRLCLEIMVSSALLAGASDVPGHINRVMGGLLKAKNNDYGNAFASYGSFGVIVRMTDKVVRVINLLDSNTPVMVRESVEDTLNDLIGYAALLYTLVRAEKEGVQG